MQIFKYTKYSSFSIIDPLEKHLTAIGIVPDNVPDDFILKTVVLVT